MGRTSSGRGEAKRSAVWPNLLLALVSCCIGLVLLEIAMRVLIATTDVPWHAPDALLGYRLEPSQEGRFITPEASGTFRINPQGFNNDQDYSPQRIGRRFRVAVLGDSFIEALQVSRGLRVFDRLEAGLRASGVDAEVYTFAVSGYGTGQELLLLEHEVLPYHPDLVVLLFVQNDLADTACVLASDRAKPCFFLGPGGQLLRKDADPHRPNRLARLACQSALVRYFLVQRRTLERLRALRDPKPFDALVGIYAKTPTIELEEGWRVAEACLARMVALSRDAGAEFLVTNQVAISPGRAEMVRGGGADVDQPAHRLADIARARGIPFFDLGPAFKSAATTVAEPLIIPNDGHWSARGHQVAAEALLGPIRSALLRNSGNSGTTPESVRP